MKLRFIEVQQVIGQLEQLFNIIQFKTLVFHLLNYSVLSSIKKGSYKLPITKQPILILRYLNCLIKLYKESEFKPN
jgi:hypothetical protein